MHNEDLARVRRIPFVSSFRNLINSLLIRGRPGRWIFMFIWFRIDPTVRLRVVCVSQIVLLKFSSLFRGSFHNSLALLGTVGHPPASLAWVLDLSGLYACSSSRSPRSPLAWTAPLLVNITYL